MSRRGRAAVLAVGWLACARVPAHPSGAGPLPAQADEPVESPAALATYLDECATRLQARDVGLARVARACPGIDYRVLHGLLAGALDARDWAARVNGARLRELADATRTFAIVLPRAPDRARLAPLLVRAQQRELDTRSWLRRWLDRIGDWLAAQRSERPMPDSWWGRILTELGRALPDLDTLRRGANLIVVALAALLALYGLWRFRVLSALGQRLPGRRPASLVPGDAAVPLPDDPAARLVTRFAARLAELEAGGILPYARALSCREVAQRLAGHDALAALGLAAPLLERLAYAPVPPDEAALIAADEAIARLEVPR